MKKINKEYEDAHFSREKLFIKSTGSDVCFTCEESKHKRAQIILDRRRIGYLIKALTNFLEEEVNLIEESE